jgi:F0F1-type ATP synthase assembly protein I
MSTREQLGEVSAIRQAEYRRVVQQNQSFTTRMFATIIAAALVLPAMGAVIDAAFVGSPALLLLGFVFLLGFGVAYYIFLDCALEESTVDETESGQNLATNIIDETPLVLRQMAPPKIAYSLPREPKLMRHAHIQDQRATAPH